MGRRKKYTEENPRPTICPQCKRERKNFIGRICKLCFEKFVLGTRELKSWQMPYPYNGKTYIRYRKNGEKY